LVKEGGVGRLRGFGRREQLGEAAGGGGEVELLEQLPYARDGIPRGGRRLLKLAV
jgi:hypothetical protein